MSLRRAVGPENPNWILLTWIASPSARNDGDLMR